MSQCIHTRAEFRRRRNRERNERLSAVSRGEIGIDRPCANRAVRPPLLVPPWQKAVARRRGELRAAVRLASCLATPLVARLATSLRRKRHPLLVQELTTRGATATLRRVPRIFRSAKRPLPSNLPRIPRFEGLVPTFEKRGTTCPTCEIWATLALTTRSHTWVLGHRKNLSIAAINAAPATFYRAALSACLGVQTKISRRRQLWSIVPKRSSSGMSGI